MEDKKPNWLEIVIKVLSGRWIFTVAAAFIFIYVAVTGMMKPEDVKEMLMLIAAFYFMQRSIERPRNP